MLKRFVNICHHCHWPEPAPPLCPALGAAYVWSASFGTAAAGGILIWSLLCHTVLGFHGSKVAELH